MSLKIAVQMDPIQRINIKGDSTFALLLEAQKRGHQLAYYTPDRLALLNGRVFAHVESLSVRDKAGDHLPWINRGGRSSRNSTSCCCAKTPLSTWPM